MPVEAKPLFRPDVLRPYLTAFQLPTHVELCRPKLAHWAELIVSGRADSFKEQETLPIAQPSDSIRKRTEEQVARLVEIARTQQTTRHDLLDWLRVEYEIAKPTMKLQAPTELDSDAFVAEVKKIRGKKKPLSAPALKSLREEYSRSIEPARAMAVEALQLENEISCLVNEAYGLTVSEAAKLGATFAAKREPQIRRRKVRVPEEELVFAGATRARNGHWRWGPAPRKWPRF